MNEKTLKKRVPVDEKIDELIEWYKKYPRIKLIGRVKDHSTSYYGDEAKEYGIDDRDLREYHEKMEKYLEYVITRKRAGQLTDEQINRCKEGNLGLIFGYPDEVKRFSEEYQIKEETALDIIRICGSVENFINSYKTGTLKKQGLMFRDGFIPTANKRNKIDMDSNPNANNYLRLIQTIGSSMGFQPYYHENLYPQYNNIIVFSSKEIDEALHILNPREEEIIRLRYGLDDGKSKDLGQTGEKLGVSRERIRQIEAKTLRKIMETQRDVFEEIMPVALGQIGDLMEEEGYSQDERLPEWLNFLEYNAMITDDEKKILSQIVDDIWDSKMLFRENRDEQSSDFDVKRLEVIKEIKANIKKREEQKRLSEEQELTQEEQKELFERSILETTIEDLNLSVRSFNIIKRAGIHNLQGLLHKSKEEVLKFRGMGKVTSDEIISKLEEYGLMFNEDGELELNEIEETKETEDLQDEIDAIYVENGETDMNGRKKMESINVPIGRLGLKPKVWRVLTERGIKTVQDIIDQDERDLMHFRGIGSKSLDEIIEKVKVYREETIEGTARAKILEDVRKLLPARTRTILARENYINDDNSCSILQLIDMEEEELVEFLDSIKGLATSSVEETRKIFSEYKNSKEYKDIMEMLNESRQTVQGETRDSSSEQITTEDKMPEELEDMPVEELQQIIANNDQTIEGNNVAIKKALVQRILSQQKTIAEQQSEISKLNSQKKEDI